MDQCVLMKLKSNQNAKKMTVHVCYAAFRSREFIYFVIVWCLAKSSLSTRRKKNSQFLRSLIVKNSDYVCVSVFWKQYIILNFMKFHIDTKTFYLQLFNLTWIKVAKCLHNRIIHWKLYKNVTFYHQ